MKMTLSKTMRMGKKGQLKIWMLPLNTIKWLLDLFKGVASPDRQIESIDNKIKRFREELTRTDDPVRVKQIKEAIDILEKEKGEVEQEEETQKTKEKVDNLKAQSLKLVEEGKGGSPENISIKEEVQKEERVLAEAEKKAVMAETEAAKAEKKVAEAKKVELEAEEEALIRQKEKLERESETETSKLSDYTGIKGVGPKLQKYLKALEMSDEKIRTMELDEFTTIMRGRNPGLEIGKIKKIYRHAMSNAETDEGSLGKELKRKARIEGIDERLALLRTHDEEEEHKDVEGAIHEEEDLAEESAEEGKSRFEKYSGESAERLQEIGTGIKSSARGIKEGAKAAAGAVGEEAREIKKDAQWAWKNKKKAIAGVVGLGAKGAATVGRGIGKGTKRVYEFARPDDEVQLLHWWFFGAIMLDFVYPFLLGFVPGFPTFNTVSMILFEFIYFGVILWALRGLVFGKLHDMRTRMWFMGAILFAIALFHAGYSQGVTALGLEKSILGSPFLWPVWTFTGGILGSHIFHVEVKFASIYFKIWGVFWVAYLSLGTPLLSQAAQFAGGPLEKLDVRDEIDYWGQGGDLITTGSKGVWYYASCGFDTSFGMTGENMAECINKKWALDKKTPEQLAQEEGEERARRVFRGGLKTKEPAITFSFDDYDKFPSTAEVYPNTPYATIYKKFSVKTRKHLPFEFRCRKKGETLYDFGLASPWDLEIEGNERSDVTQPVKMSCQYDLSMLGQMPKGKQEIDFVASTAMEVNSRLWVFFIDENEISFDSLMDDIQRTKKTGRTLSLPGADESGMERMDLIINVPEYRDVVQRAVSSQEKKVTVRSSDDLVSQSDNAPMTVEIDIGEVMIGTKQDGTKQASLDIAVGNNLKKGKIKEIASGSITLPKGLVPINGFCPLLILDSGVEVDGYITYPIDNSALKGKQWHVIEEGESDVLPSCRLSIPQRLEDETPNPLLSLPVNIMKTKLIDVDLSYQYSLIGSGKIIKEIAESGRIYAGALEYFPVTDARGRDAIMELLPKPEEDHLKFGAGRTTGNERSGKKHEGVDIMVEEGAEVVATVTGTVLKNGCNELGGWRVLIEEKDAPNTHHYYAHLEKQSTLEEGMDIEAGFPIGYVGTTVGCEPCQDDEEKLCAIQDKTVDHLHYGIYVEDTAYDPWNALVNAEKVAEPYGEAT